MRDLNEFENLSVLMVIPTFERMGGAQHQLQDLSCELNANGVQIDFCAPLDNISKRNISSRWFARVVNFFSVVKIIRLAFTSCRRYDLVHLHGLGIPFYIFTLVGRINRNIIIVKIPRTGEGSYLRLVQESTVRKLLFRLSMKSVQRFIILTADGRDELRALGVPDMRIEEIPNGVIVKDKGLVRIGCPPLRICFAGRLIARKRVDILIDQAISQFRKF